jgi:hypothetical protein
MSRTKQMKLNHLKCKAIFFLTLKKYENVKTIPGNSKGRYQLK